jgi:hypothetical protein
MWVKKKLIPITKVVIIIMSLYIFSYLVLMCRGKNLSYSYDGKEWSFGGSKGLTAYYFPWSSSFDPQILENERKICQFYRPLIQLDARLTKDKHIYHEIAPECGR